MKYYRHAVTGDVYAFEVDGSQDGLIGDDLRAMSGDEVERHLNPTLRLRTRAEVEALRLRAYAEPITGSDRYFAEAERESLLGNPEKAETAKRLGLERFAEIQAQYPWPEDSAATSNT